MPFQKMSTNQPLRLWSTNRVSRRAIDRSWESFRCRWMLGLKSEDRYGKIAFQELSRARKVGRTCYIRERFSCWSTARGTCARPFFRGLPSSHNPVYDNEAGRGNIGGTRHGSALLVHWKCEVEELNRISTSMPWKQARGWDSFGTTQSRAKIRTLVQSRNAI